MPRVTFSAPVRNVKHTVNMQAPTRLTDVHAWIKAARKLIPAVPLIASHTTWSIIHEDIDEHHIMLGFEDSRTGERTSLIIERRYDTIASRTV